MITIKTKEEIKTLREGGKILAAILNKLAEMVKPEVTTGELEDRASELIKKAGGRPSFKKYKSKHDRKAFPTTLCTSINNEVVHAPSIPARKLNKGDIIGLDLGMAYPSGPGKKELYTDMAVTVGVGKISDQAQELIQVTEESLKHAINQVKPDNVLDNIGVAIQSIAEVAKGFSVVRELVGHGVGYDVHEEPKVPNYVVQGKKSESIILKPGMVLAIEPMVNVGGWKIETLEDGFTVVTADSSLSAHFEHTVAVVESGYEILTSLE